MMPEKGLTIVDKAALEVSVTKKKKSLFILVIFFISVGTWLEVLQACGVLVKGTKGCLSQQSPT